MISSYLAELGAVGKVQSHGRFTLAEDRPWGCLLCLVGAVIHTTGVRWLKLRTGPRQITVEANLPLVGDFALGSEAGAHLQVGKRSLRVTGCPNIPLAALTERLQTASVPITIDGHPINRPLDLAPCLIFRRFPGARLRLAEENGVIQDEAQGPHEAALALGHRTFSSFGKAVTTLVLVVQGVAYPMQTDLGFPNARAVVLADTLRRTPCGWEIVEDGAFLEILGWLRGEFTCMARRLREQAWSGSLSRLAQPIVDRL